MKKIVFAVAIFLFATGVWAAPPSATIVYQPMTAEGLAAGYPFEAWVYFDRSPDPAVLGYAFPAGTTFRFKFPQSFVPQSTHSPQAVLLSGWPQGAITIPFTVALDPRDPRTIVLKLTTELAAVPPERSGLKAIHLRGGLRNPKQAGDYTIAVQITGAGSWSGKTQAVARITPKPVPNIAAYNQLHDSRNEDWQHVKTGQLATLPIDLLVTLPDKCRSSITLRPLKEGDLEITSEGARIGTITHRGVPISLSPESFGPGFARLGIVRFHVTAGPAPGKAEIEARLDGGTSYRIQVIVER